MAYSKSLFLDRPDSYEPINKESHYRSVVQYAGNVAAGFGKFTATDVKHFTENHGVTIYYPLERMAELSRCTGVLITPGDISSFESSESMRTSLKMYRGALCYGCASIVTDADHLRSPRHEMTMRAQMYRLNLSRDRARGYQQWLYNYRPRATQEIMAQKVVMFGRARREPQITAYLDINEYRDAVSSVEYYCQPMYAHADGAGALSNPIPFIRGSAPLGSGTIINFQLRVMNRSKATVDVITCAVMDDVYNYRERGVVQEEMNIGFHFQYGMIGVQHYSVQFWLRVTEQGHPTRFYPICCEVIWTWTRPDFQHRAQKILEETPNHPSLSTDEFQLSAIPSFEHNPPRLMTVSDGIERICPRIQFGSSILRQYLNSWDALVMHSGDNGFGISKRPFDLTIPHEGWNIPMNTSALIHPATPVTRSNIAHRCLAELVGQAQQEEDDPEHAPVWHLQIKPNEEFAHLAVMEVMEVDGINSEDAAQPPIEAMFAQVTVKASDFRGLQLNSDDARLLHPEGRYKVTVKVREEFPVDENYHRLTLMMNRAAMPFINDWQHLCAQRVDVPCQLIPPPSRVPELLAGMYHCLLYDIIETSPPPPPKTEFVDGEAMDLNEDEAENQIEDRVSRRKEFQQNYRAAWKRVFDGVMREFPWEPIRNAARKWPEPLPADIADRLSDLDDSQLQAFHAVHRGTRFTLCLAPPGTGKTYLTAVTTVLLHRASPNANFLCVAPTNAAADVLAQKILTYMNTMGLTIEPNTFIRYVRHNYDLDKLGKLKQYTNSERQEDGTYSVVTLASQKLARYRIVVCTVDLAILDVANCRYIFDEEGNPRIDMLIVDEAASLPLPKLALLLPLVAQGQLLMLGDVNQLPAYITSSKVRFLAGDESAMQFLLNIIQVNESGVFTTLMNNYRWRREIIFSSNREVYHQNKLTSARHQMLSEQFNELNKRSNGQLATFVFPGDTREATDHKTPGYGVSFLHVVGRMTRLGISFYNIEEAFLVEEIITRMVKCGVDPVNIGVDATYAAQAQLLEQLLLPRLPAIRIGCSNTWQGNERDFMVISLVRSDPCRDAYGECMDMGFLDDFRRLNVSLTRARLGQVVIGNALRFYNHYLVSEILRQVCSRDGWISDPLSFENGHDLMIGGHLSTPIAIPYLVHAKICETWPDNEGGIDFYNSTGRMGQPPALKLCLGQPGLHHCTDHRLPVPLVARQHHFPSN